MKTSDVFFTLLYGGAFFFVLYFIVSLFARRTKPTTVIVYDKTPVVSELTWWPWLGGTYNYWPYWYLGGGNGGYSYYNKPLARDGSHRHREWSEDRPWGGDGRGAHGGGGRHGGGDVHTGRAHGDGGIGSSH